MANSQQHFHVCQYCGAVFFDKAVFMKHVYQHEHELDYLRRQLTVEIGNLIIRYAENRNDVVASLKLNAFLKYLMTGSLNGDELESVGLGRYVPLLQLERERVAREFSHLVETILDVDEGLVGSVLEQVEWERLLPEVRRVLERRGFGVQKVSYIA